MDNVLITGTTSGITLRCVFIFAPIYYHITAYFTILHFTVPTTNA